MYSNLVFGALREPHLKKQGSFYFRDKDEGTFDKHEYLGNGNLVDKRLLLNEMYLILPWKIIKKNFSSPELYLSISMFFGGVSTDQLS